mgnify:CR=1 FL=1
MEKCLSKYIVFIITCNGEYHYRHFNNREMAYDFAFEAAWDIANVEYVQIYSSEGGYLTGKF